MSIPVVILFMTLMTSQQGAEARLRNARQLRIRREASCNETSPCNLMGHRPNQTLNLDKCTADNYSRPDRLNELALSPWTYKNCYDENRYPENILAAVCKGRFCEQPLAEMRSVAIQHIMEVTYRFLDQGEQKNCIDHLEVPIGCTCIPD
ncbi:interleukin-17F-like isoform X1 [Hemitrygon akajei]|uniref:interleukin-17F-like isoform X1 n=2 Tax=Hemitrygon akajei TaxID=2704970 RepID=UPI003BFA1922